MPLIRKEIDVSFTPAQMYDLVNDVEKYAEFLPWCSASEVLSRTDDEVRATLYLSGGGIEKSFTTCDRLQQNKMIEVVLVSGPFKQLEGFWTFEPTEKGCKVVLSLEFEMAGGLLSFAFGPIFSQIANTLVDAFNERAQVTYNQQ